MSRRRMSCTNCLFVSGSITLTAAVIIVGISFFAPYWLSNLSAAAAEERQYTDPVGGHYLPSTGNVSDYPDRGLWAQCGDECHWFWEDDYMIQQHLFTPLSQYIPPPTFTLIIIIIIINDNVYGAILMTMVTARVHPVHLMNADR